MVPTGKVAGLGACGEGHPETVRQGVPGEVLRIRSSTLVAWAVSGGTWEARTVCFQRLGKESWWCGSSHPAAVDVTFGHPGSLEGGCTRSHKGVPIAGWGCPLSTHLGTK